jgi:IS5 family transposase
MKQTHKGRNWHFGMKLHIGADKRGIVHTVRATAANVADITQLPDLLHGQERSCSAIKRTGKKTIESFSGLGECATGSTDARPRSGR